MTLKCKSGMTGNIVYIHTVSRVWFEDGRVWYTKEGSDQRLGYNYQLLEILEDCV